MKRKAQIISRPTTRARRVVVALRMAGIAGQDKLNGVFEYLSEGRRWQLGIYRTRHEFTAETVHRELENGAEGFIVGIPETDDAFAALAQTHVPVVMMNVKGGGLENRAQSLAIVRSDAESVGREAATALLRQGVYKCYGYAGYRTDEDWSRERGRAFRDTLEKAGFIGRMFDVTHFKDKIEDRAALTHWLKTLPKPCGILAACDDRAYEILDVCREAGIRVPAEVGLLGVNNDPILCENADPKLSSVQPDFVGEGRLAAELLDQLMSTPSAARSLHKVGIRSIVHRESTFPLSESGRLVQKALAFIERNALKGIGVPDVARHLKVSQSLIALRFRELQRESIYETILRLRLDEVKRRLRTTHDAIDSIALACGWNNPNALKNLFRRRFGVSMRTFRTSGV